MWIGFERFDLGRTHRAALQSEADGAAVAQPGAVPGVGGDEIPLGRHVQRRQARHAFPEQIPHEAGADFPVGHRRGRVVRADHVTEVVNQSRHLEFEIVGRLACEHLRALEAVLQDVDRVAVGAERVERTVGLRDELDQLVHRSHRHDLHDEHGTRRCRYGEPVISAPPLTLHEIADRVWVWLQPGGESGVSNAGVVADDDGLTVIDTLMVRSQWAPFAAAVKELGGTVKRVVLTHAHIDHVGGTTAFRNAMILGSPMTSDLLDQTMPVDAYKAFMPVFEEGFDELAVLGTRPVSHIVDEAAQLTERIEVLPARGHTDGDLMVLIDDASVLFAGDLCFFGVTPLAFQGDPAAWAAVLDVVGELADVIVPGHGPIGGAAAVGALRDYLTHCVTGTIPPGPWDTWLERAERDPINIEKAAMLRAGDDGMPPSMLRALGLS